MSLLLSRVGSPPVVPTSTPLRMLMGLGLTLPLWIFIGV